MCGDISDSRRVWQRRDADPAKENSSDRRECVFLCMCVCVLKPVSLKETLELASEIVTLGDTKKKNV